MTPIDLALALVLTSTPAEPRHLTPGERQLYRLAVEWQEAAQSERADRQACERKLEDATQAAEMPPVVVAPEPDAPVVWPWIAGGAALVVAAFVGGAVLL